MSVAAIITDSLGVELTKPATYAGVYPVVVRQTAATAANSIVWSLFNPVGSGKTIFIRSVLLQMFFDGVAAATLMKYEIVKYTGVTAQTGTVVTPLHKRSSLAAALVAAAKVLDTGAALTNGTAQSPIQIGAMGRVTQTATNFQSMLSTPLAQNERGTLSALAIELAAGEALAIRQSAVSVIGDNLVGMIETAES